ncbi:hypothetical protein [Arthrobacter sp. CAN_C5]|uniref:hypothetical protein n=1 Tax=Arthrobacter sp. CAN_C5 TaxID=2760706 RepID=UPI001AE3BBFB|nr:hypothetical protein [Arthrobacter sp. CAN_C5]MBP2216804.1 hypothetical protein [Arthrobacter sp. CAN_C5]
MEPWQIAVITTATGGAFALLGGWLGTRWGKKTEHEQWLRNEKRQQYWHLYQELAHLSESLPRRSRGVPIESLLEVKATTERLKKNQSTLFLPTQITAEVGEVLRRTNAYIDDWTAQKPNEANIMPVDERIQNILNLMRKDLRID